MDCPGAPKSIPHYLLVRHIQIVCAASCDKVKHERAERATNFVSLVLNFITNNKFSIFFGKQIVEDEGIGADVRGADLRSADSGGGIEFGGQDIDYALFAIVNTNRE